MFFSGVALLTQLPAANRLVQALEQRGAVEADEAACLLLAVDGGPLRLARTVLERTVEADARLEWRGELVTLAPSPLAPIALERARFCVIDLETTSLRPGMGRISELAAVVLERDKRVAELEAVGPAASSEDTLARLAGLAAGSVLAGHNVRFDLAFLQRAWPDPGVRIASPVVDTLVLARRLLRGRLERFDLDRLSELVGAGEPPCHRALPDARAAVDVLRYLVDVARERGASSVGDLCALCRPLRRTGGTDRSPADHLAFGHDAERARGRLTDLDRLVR